ncbi:hypothetical protein [Nonomuraea africana]|uniref:Uncharacterized protein n=1 Tax=Nonomuraea africana TaxID=46171 RepID=A0ABR9KKQ8_9ACTN|nr:hypothetical protein [Nonomuraea africana]MBE1562198.1 hypothetical protein [Nonomuraea africana]
MGCWEASGAEPRGGEHAGEFLFLLWGHAGAHPVVPQDVAGSVGVRHMIDANPGRGSREVIPVERGQGQKDGLTIGMWHSEVCPVIGLQGE